MSHHDWPGYLIDETTIECFGDAHPAVAVDTNGNTGYLLIDPHHHCHGCCSFTTPEHEQLGPLPSRFIRSTGMTCAATARTTDQRCRTRPRPGSRYCTNHATENR